MFLKNCQQNNNSQSNLAISIIAANLGFQPHKPLSNTILPRTTQLPAKWHLFPPDSFSRVHECDRQHTYRRTHHAMVTHTATGGITFSSIGSSTAFYSDFFVRQWRVQVFIPIKHVTLVAGLPPSKHSLRNCQQ